MIEAVFHGLILAFGLILPLGVQNIFVFNQGALQPTFIRTLPVVLTASICDTILILASVMGVSLIVLTVVWLETFILIAGILFLIYMGWILWKTKQENMEEGKNLSVKKQILFAASVSVLNPHAILDTVGVIGVSSLNYTGDEKWAFTISAILVSWLWFSVLAIAGRFVSRLGQNGKLLHLLNKISACIIWTMALYMALKVF
ncbi:LysE/ArgO family amino acid transporter [Jeotgalibacillus soli]|uniref:LysE/ArgO family amino acid transporter n=1 Tax=Jeotgalibacillus soli TaxID=889306 RepID=UPI000597B7CE|nr:LysE/ArgO family amino acid transporter [Jeotgalibacillus soli]